MKPIIALEADGVLFDDCQMLRAWAQAIGVLPALRDPLAYWPQPLGCAPAGAH